MKGKISISRVRRFSEEDYIEIRMEDVVSGVSFLKVEMDLASFANAITALSFQDCEFTLNADNVGKKREIKQVIVKRPGFANKSGANSILEPHTVDGWMPRKDDIFNPHCWVGKDEVSVTFIRFV